MGRDWLNACTQVAPSATTQSYRLQRPSQASDPREAENCTRKALRQTGANTVDRLPTAIGLCQATASLLWSHAVVFLGLKLPLSTLASFRAIVFINGPLDVVIAGGQLLVQLALRVLITANDFLLSQVVSR